MSETRFVIFGLDQETVHEFAKDAQTRCEEKGAEFTGPSILPTLKCGKVIRYLDIEHSLNTGSTDAPNWFEAIELTDSEVEKITSETVSAADKNQNMIFGRLIRVHADNVAAELADKELPSDVFLRVSVDTRKIQKAKRDVLHSYDPNSDYVTDLDYEANN